MTRQQSDGHSPSRERHTNLVLRTVGTTDVDQLVELYDQLHPTHAPIDRNAARHHWSTVQQHDGHHIHGVFDTAGYKHHLVATCTMQLIPGLTNLRRPFAVLENLVVRDSYRQQGIGSLLISHVLDQAWQHNCYKVLLTTGTDNIAAQQLYETCGFDGTTKQAYIARPPDWPT